MEKEYIFGVDVGGTSIKAGMFTTDGTLLDKWQIPTDKSRDGNNILPDIAGSLKNKMNQKGIDKERFIGVGVGVPGPVDKNGIVHRCVNLGWGVFSIADCMAELTGMKVMASNDANVAALGEMWKGSGMGFKNIVFITLGTGVGGGIVCDGRLIVGENGSAGEIGHITVDINEKSQCTCGKHGCLEQYASATGMAAQARKLIESGMETSLNDVNAKAIVDGAKKGDKLCLLVMEKMGYALGLGLSHAGEICDPEVYIIGGGVSKAGDFILGFIEKYYKEYSFHAVRNAKFKIASLGNDAGIYGAAGLLL